MSEKQPLVTGPQPPSAPPTYSAPQAPPPTYTPQAYTPPAQGGGGYHAPPPPPQGGYQGQQSNTTVYIQPAQQSRTVVVDIKPPNYVVLSVITMVFFCWIFGLIALLAGMQVDSMWLTGQRDEARRQSLRARHWNIAGIITGVVVIVGTIVTVVAVNVSVTTCYDC